MSPVPQEDGPTGESEAKALEKLPNHYNERLGEQLVFNGLDPAGAQKLGGK